jgi:hypothetical protein
VMDVTFRKVLAVSAALALSRSSHISDNKGKSGLASDEKLDRLFRFDT